MILDMGIPHLHTTWFATKVEVNGLDLSRVAPATKGNKVNRQDMLQSIERVMKNWGSHGKDMILNFAMQR